MTRASHAARSIAAGTILTASRADVAVAAAVTRLALTDFRSYASLRLEAPRGPIVLTGPNGAGKTNLLEALSFLAPGRGIRRARLGDIDRHAGNRPWAVAATVADAAGPTEIGTGRLPAEDHARERRVVRIDGSDRSGQTALAEIAAFVWLTPDMDRLLQDGASGRRRFLDRLIYGFDPAHAGQIAAYEHAMRERARLLKLGRSDDSWLAALEQTMAEKGVAIAAARRDMAARLDGAGDLGIGRFPRARVRVTGAVEDWLGDGPALGAEDRFRAALAGARGADAAAGTTAIGPHRGDMAVHHGETGMPAAQCSTGQQKALLLSVVMANARLLTLDRGTPPILLLDEVVAHLDEGRRTALFEEILALGTQAWLTGTDLEPFQDLAGAAAFYAVDNATLNPIDRGAGT